MCRCWLHIIRPSDHGRAHAQPVRPARLVRALVSPCALLPPPPAQLLSTCGGSVPPIFPSTSRNVSENSAANALVGPPLVALSNATDIAITYTLIDSNSSVNGSDLFKVCAAVYRLRVTSPPLWPVACGLLIGVGWPLLSPGKELMVCGL
jgi:hypothetical protein